MRQPQAHLLSPPVLSVPEAAQRLQVNSARVRAMIRAGLLDAAKLGGRWVVSAESVDRRAKVSAEPGRHFSSKRAWGLLLLAGGSSPDWLSRSDLSRLRRRLKESTLEELAPRLRSRALTDALRAHPSDLQRLAAEDALVLAGLSAASHYDLGLAYPADSLEAYVPIKQVAGLKKKYALQPSATPNVILRVVEGVWPFEEGATVAPATVVGLDLLESDDARLRRAGQVLLRRQR